MDYQKQAQQVMQQYTGVPGDAPEPPTVFTQVTNQLGDHTNVIREMSANIRRCCDLLDGSVPEPATAGEAKMDRPSHQIPRLYQALGEQNGEIEYLKNQLARLDTILSGKS